MARFFGYFFLFHHVQVVCDLEIICYVLDRGEKANFVCLFSNMTDMFASATYNLKVCLPSLGSKRITSFVLDLLAKKPPPTKMSLFCTCEEQKPRSENSLIWAFVIRMCKKGIHPNVFHVSSAGPDLASYSRHLLFAFVLKLFFIGGFRALYLSVSRSYVIFFAFINSSRKHY